MHKSEIKRLKQERDAVKRLLAEAEEGLRKAPPGGVLHGHWLFKVERRREDLKNLNDRLGRHG